MDKSLDETKRKATSKGPFTPAITPANVGQKSGGEVNWDAASATPYTETEK
jgi:hypothetical protein